MTQRLYHGETLEDGREFLIIESERGYGFIITVKINTGSMQAEFYIDADTARDFGRHLNAAAETDT